MEKWVFKTQNDCSGVQNKGCKTASSTNSNFNDSADKWWNTACFAPTYLWLYRTRSPKGVSSTRHFLDDNMASICSFAGRDLHGNETRSFPQLSPRKKTTYDFQHTLVGTCNGIALIQHGKSLINHRCVDAFTPYSKCKWLEDETHTRRTHHFQERIRK